MRRRSARPPFPPTPLCPLPPNNAHHTQEGELGVSGALGRARRMHRGRGAGLRGPPQHSTHCRYLFFFLRSRENSLVFFLWGRAGRGGLHLGEMQMWARPAPFPHRPPLCSEEC